MTLAPLTSLGLFIATNLLAATSQRRYAIKRSEGPVFCRTNHTLAGIQSPKGTSQLFPALEALGKWKKLTPVPEGRPEFSRSSKGAANFEGLAASLKRCADA
jgi:hypothetical protein